MEDQQTDQTMKTSPTSTQGEGGPHKINCEECDGYHDCPRMRGIDYCMGAAKWLELRAGKDKSPEEAGG